jgi:hypothetical protein
MMRPLALGCAVAALLLTGPGLAKADPILPSLIDLYNTGVDGSGAVVADGTAETHYTLITVPSGSTSVYAWTGAGPAPIPPWLGDSTASRWIGPPDASGPEGDYVYQTTFDLTGFDPGSVTITGRFASENQSSVFLNGGTTAYGTTNTGQDSSTQWWAFSLTGGFQSGVNTIEFRVHNTVSGQATEGSTGLRVEFLTAAAEALEQPPSATPEPATTALLAAGGLGLAVARLRRRKAAV